MKYKKTLTIIILLLAVMLFSVGMIVKEADERQQDISDFHAWKNDLHHRPSAYKRGHSNACGKKQVAGKHRGQHSYQ